MNPESRLAEIITALEDAGLHCLILGGHAARYYGVNRTTIDFDLHLAPDGWSDLSERLARSVLWTTQPVIEGPSWRPHDFRRFQIGRLPDGREEWLEFWRHNHLLPPFQEAFARREEGIYGGCRLAFFSLPDLIHSKETERASDWLDVAKLEEVLDARLLARVLQGELSLPIALSRVRSRCGFESHLQRKHLEDPSLVEQALLQSAVPMTIAYLLPAAPSTTPTAQWTNLEPIILHRLRTTAVGSTLHLALVEAVRRRHMLDCQEADRANKQAVRALQGNMPT